MIRISGEPYIDHLLAVATLAGPAVALGYEIGLCHDLLEDTPTAPAELYAALFVFGYSEAAADQITKIVVELTDVFTATAYPQLRKKERKALEADRLLQISSSGQTVKYSDLIYNISWVLRYQPKKAKKYLRKKARLLKAMDKGDTSLQKKALKMIRKAQDEKQ